MLTPEGPDRSSANSVIAARRLRAPGRAGSHRMYRRVALLIVLASATVASGSAAPEAYADTQDQQFLHMVHENHIGGDDSTLLDYARQFCDSTTGVQLPARPGLYRQGVRPDQFYAVNQAASHVYCPQRLATPPTNSFTGAALTSSGRDPNTGVESTVSTNASRSLFVCPPPRCRQQRG